MNIEEIKEKLFSYRIIDERTGCWLFTGSTNQNGYGHLWINGVLQATHKLSYRIFKGEPINNVNHIRECPNRHCFNPDHLYDGTQSENATDRYIMGRLSYNSLKTHCMNGHEFNEENTYIEAKNGKRHCKQCRHDRYEQRKLGLR